MNPISFTLNNQVVNIDGLAPTTTLLQYLRTHRQLTGTKEGCAEGDCGACTVVILDEPVSSKPQWRSVNSCLVLLPMLHGKQVFTVEGLRTGQTLHPVQEAVVRHLGSQCGYCTPGVVMTLVEACYRTDLDKEWKLDDQLCGTLCRCTGYRPIRDAAHEIAGSCPEGALSNASAQPLPAPQALSYHDKGHQFERPTTLSELWAAMATYPEHTFVAGATDVGLWVTKQHQKWPVIIGLDSVHEMKQLRVENERWSVGAAVRLADLEDEADRSLPALARMLRFFGSRQIKNRATIGGNLCNASPIGDLAPILIALDATLIVGNAKGERTIPIQEFFIGYRTTAMQTDEVLLRIEFLSPSPDTKIAAYKVSKRREMDISSVSSGMRVSVNEHNNVESIILAYGGMAATPARAHQTEQLLLGASWTEQNISATLNTLAKDFTPLSDHRGSDWYRLKVAQNLLLGFFHETQNTPQPALPDKPSGTITFGVRS